MFVIKKYWQKIIDILAVQVYFKVQSACVYIIRFIERDAFFNVNSADVFKSLSDCLTSFTYTFMFYWSLWKGNR